MIAAVVAPVFHTYVNGAVPIVELAVNVVFVPAHTVVVPAILGVGFGVTVIVVVADVAVQPAAAVAVTV